MKDRQDKCKCKHRNWVLATYPDGTATSIYEVYCKDCKNFINLFTGEIINDKGLIVFANCTYFNTLTIPVMSPWLK